MALAGHASSELIKRDKQLYKQEDRLMQFTPQSKAADLLPMPPLYNSPGSQESSANRSSGTKTLQAGGQTRAAHSAVQGHRPTAHAASVSTGRAVRKAQRIDHQRFWQITLRWLLLLPKPPW